MTQQAMTAGPPTKGSMPTGGRWGWYQDHEGKEWRRVSRLVKYAENDTYNLEQWKLRQVAEGLAIRDDLVLAVKAMGRPDPAEGWSRADKDKLNGLTKDAMNAAKQADGARKGTAMHDLTERLDRGEDIESVARGLPAGPARTLRAYAFLRRANGWRTIEIERTVVLDELEVAGTLDRIEQIDGLTELLGPWICQHGHNHGSDESQVIADVKSEAEPWLNGLHIGPQLAIYSRAKRMWRPLGGTVTVKGEVTVPAGEYVPTPCVRQDVGIVVHVHDGDAVPYFLNLGEGWNAAQAAYRQMLREQSAKRKLGSAGAWFVAMPGVERPPAEWVAQQASAVATDRGGQRCLICSESVQAGATNCRKCGSAVAQVAVTRPDGMVEFQPATTMGEAPAGTQVHGVLDEVDKSAIEAVWAATDVHGPGSTLSAVYTIYVEVCGRAWGGRVAAAADARRRQIDCPQRALHTPASGAAKCACGWIAGMPA